MKTTIGFINHGIPNLPRVNATPAARLAYFRAVGMVKCGQYWRSARQCMSAPEVSDLSPGFNVRYPGTPHERRTPIMMAWTPDHMRNERWADDVEHSTVEHSGWFTSPDCAGKIRAFVFNLPHDRFGAGYEVTDTGERVYYLEVFERDRDAAGFGDSEARHYAEEEYEYQERYQAAHKLRDKIEVQGVELSRLFALRNHPTLGDNARTDLADKIEELRALRDKLADDYSDIEI